MHLLAVLMLRWQPPPLLLCTNNRHPVTGDGFKEDVDWIVQEWD